MKINNTQRQEIQNLLLKGYLYKAIKKYFLKKYRSTNLSTGDILVVEKTMKLNRSMKQNNMYLQVNSVMNNAELVNKIKIGMILFFISLLVVTLCIWFLMSPKVALIFISVIIFLIGILTFISYRKFVKGKKKLK